MKSGDKVVLECISYVFTTPIPTRDSMEICCSASIVCAGRETEKIPQEKQRDAAELRQRWRDRDQSAAEHAADRRADEAKKIVNPGCRAASAGRNPAAEKRRQHRLINAVAEKKRRAGGIENQIVTSAEEIKRVPRYRREPADHNRRAETAGFFGPPHVRKNQEN